ncbi:MAG: YeeE/YedE thiosulfate transporter family protein [Candidatus Brocadiia bacterium]
MFWACSLTASLSSGVIVALAPGAVPPSVAFVTMQRWSPYAVGVGIGLLVCLTFLLSGETIGVSTAFARTAGMIEKLFRGKKVEQKAYYRKFKPEIDWEWVFVAGLFGGALVSALLGGDFEIDPVPEMWAAAFGSGVLARWLVALAGGFFIGFGARCAGGCTSGHGISGTLQLALSSLLATVTLFLGGIVTALLLY